MTARAQDGDHFLCLCSMIRRFARRRFRKQWTQGAVYLFSGGFSVIISIDQSDITCVYMICMAFIPAEVLCSRSLDSFVGANAWDS